MIKLAIGLCPLILLAQTAPSFDVATVKPSDALKNAGMASGWSISVSHNGLKIIGNLQTFIKYAYGPADGYAYASQDLQLSGGPAWLDRDIYEIDGKASRKVTAGELKQMLQSLLAERFKLIVHPETRVLPVYSMAPAKGGPKLQRGDESLRSFSNGPTFLRGTTDSSVFAHHLTSALHRTVIDNTGLQGVWKFDLTWAADDVTTGPSIFTAIQEQLGLKLESAKAPVQVLIVDRAEKPSGN
jgi:uncharacterized protein (TIGR03435 family)